MRILQQLQAERTGTQRMDDFREPPFTVECGTTGKIRPDTLDANEEWHLTARVGVTFWANKAQFHDAMKVAERALIARLYEDVLAELPELRLALSDGNRRAALEICGRIESKLKG